MSMLTLFKYMKTHKHIRSYMHKRMNSCINERKHTYMHTSIYILIAEYTHFMQMNRVQVGRQVHASARTNIRYARAHKEYTALWRGVAPFESVAETLALATSSTDTTSSHPSAAAQCIGVQPSAVRPSVSAPAVLSVQMYL